MSRLFFLLSVIMAILLSGCSVHSIDPAPLPLQSGAASYAIEQADADAVLRSRWYDSFNDPELSELIAQGLENNLDIRAALSRLEQADALTRQSTARLSPEINLNANTSGRWESGASRRTSSETGLALSWEIDAFNRLQSAATADQLLRSAAAHDVETARLTLTASLAATYYRAIAQHAVLALLHQQEQADKELLTLIELRWQKGVGTRIEFLQQQGQLVQTQSLIPPARAALRTEELRLDVLLGTAPDQEERTTADHRLATVGNLPPLGIPSDLLLQRPDLRAQRDRLVAADASIGEAMAARLPRVTVTGGLFLVDSANSSGPLGSLLAGLVQPLLDWGRRKAEVEKNQALYEERLTIFTRTYLEAIEEVENILYREHRQREYIQLLDARRHLLNQNLTLAQEQFGQGVNDYLPVLDALRSLHQVERDLVLQRLQLVLLRIQLFRALGAPVATAG
ncbi:efflux transporter outer membrane subunit [Desulfobulbus alkaliphilus]|uniref:efflux transporter outer membrane subunit n=1 Tax=Desulfobulbus alkaliphilus TaxID=869814 RepID=UPI001966C07B|nr:efflux transporter outer membrane subunit [Desulfobulbus alkaliphilus]MBM9536513.1 efflux transporter outer membrane subunit [Desulfobulbus alkaliphilus]